METFVLKLAVATVPLIALVASVIMLSGISHWRVHHRFTWHRTRRTILKALAAGVMLR
jgi:hypothetical protein